jgi:glycosyltransferase involved in cell wall biosynthesis
VKVYWQYADHKTLLPTKGDYVTEVGLMLAVSRFAEVYYSGTRFDQSRSDFGLVEYPGPVEDHVPLDCDLYYVRSSPGVFRRIPKDKLRLWVADGPYDCYNSADYLVVQSQAWADDLKAGATFYWLPEERRPRPNTVVFYQVVYDGFRPLQNHPRTRLIRRTVGGNFVVGHFGRLCASSYPDAFLRLLPNLVREFPGLRYLVATGNKQRRLMLPGSTPNTVVTSYSHGDIPFAISACDLVLLCNRGPEFDVVGSNRALEASACGVPILCARSRARMELLGEDYPLMVPPFHTGRRVSFDLPVLYQTLVRVMLDNPLRGRLSAQVAVQAQRFSVENSARRMKPLFEGLLFAHGKGVK